MRAVLQEERGLMPLTPKRRNQPVRNAPAWDALMNRTRRSIKTTFAQAEGTFGLEKPGPGACGSSEPGHRQDHGADAGSQAQAGAGALVTQAGRVPILGYEYKNAFHIKRLL